MCALVYIEKIVSGRYFTKSPVGGGILAVAKSVRVRALFAGEHLDGSNASGQSSIWKESEHARPPAPTQNARLTFDSRYPLFFHVTRAA